MLLCFTQQSLIDRRHMAAYVITCNGRVNFLVEIRDFQQGYLGPVQRTRDVFRNINDRSQRLLVFVLDIIIGKHGIVTIQLQEVYLLNLIVNIHDLSVENGIKNLCHTLSDLRTVPPFKKILVLYNVCSRQETDSRARALNYW